MSSDKKADTAGVFLFLLGVTSGSFAVWQQHISAGFFVFCGGLCVALLVYDAVKDFK